MIQPGKTEESGQNIIKSVKSSDKIYKHKHK